MPDTRHTPARLARPARPAVICLALLFLFYLFSACTQDPVETDLLLPVDFSNVPEDMVLTNFHTDKIEIRIKGDPRRIERLSSETIIYPADLYTDLAFDPAGDSDSIEPGRYLLPVDRTRIPLNPAITVLDISPSYLSVRLEKKVTRVFKVHVPYVGEAAKGYMALAPACDPPSVALTGAQSLMDRIEKLQTKPVDLANADEAFKKEVPLDLANPQLFSSDRSMFIVTVPVKPVTGTRTLADIPIRILNSPETASVEPGTITIQIKGAEEAIGSKAVTDKIFAFMDLKGLGPGVYVRHAYIDIPVDLVMTDASPQVFTVKIE